MFKMLVVDDEMDVCDFVKHFFEERDYSVASAHDGEQAIRLMKKHKFDIVLLDIRMKKLDGIETLKAIRQFDKDTNVIMVTALEDQDKMDAACKLGASRYLTKPLVLEDLESAVYEYTKNVKK